MQSDYALQYENLWRHHWWWQSRKAFVLDKLRRLHARQPLRQILDVGCGNGLFFPDLARFGHVRGIEPDPLLVREHQFGETPGAGPIEVRPFDASYAPDVPMDLVLMLDVLEHIEDHLAAARHVREILAPGGAFVITVPALMGLWSQHDVANWHFRRYTKQSLQDVLTQAGFETESLQYFSGWTIGPMLLRRLATPAKGEAGDYRVRVPPRPVNAVMYGLSRVEQTVWGSRLPLGSSLLAIARPRT